MGVRSIWKGTIQFGMVSIPTKLYSATESGERISFHQVHRECMTRIKMPKWCPKCEAMLGPEEIQKVYELSEGQYVPFEDADFQALPLKSLKVIEVESFVDPSSMDSIMFEKSYYIAPGEVGGKPFELLRLAMEQSGLAAVAKLSYRDREHLSVIRPYGKALLLQTLFYANELRDVGNVEPQQLALITDKESQMALHLVQAMKAEFDLSQYEDEYNQALRQMIEAKIAGEEVAKVEVPAATTAVDLEASLRVSIEQIEAIDKLGKSKEKVKA